MNGYYRLYGGHYHIRMFINGAKMGDLCCRKDELVELVAGMPGVTFTNDLRAEVVLRSLTPAEQWEQAGRCGCRGTDDYCACQNVPDSVTIRNREAEAIS